MTLSPLRPATVHFLPPDRRTPRGVLSHHGAPPIIQPEARSRMLRQITRHALVLSMCAITFLLIAALLAGGCRGEGQPDSAPATGEGIARAQSAVESASRNVQLAKPHSDPVGKEFLGAADADHDAVRAALADALANNAQERRERADVESKLATQLATRDAELKAERDHYWGFKLRANVRRLFWIGIPAAIVLIVGYNLLSGYLATIPGLAGVGRFLINLLPIQHGAAAIRDKKAPT